MECKPHFFPRFPLHKLGFAVLSKPQNNADRVLRYNRYAKVADSRGRLSLPCLLGKMRLGQFYVKGIAASFGGSEQAPALRLSPFNGEAQHPTRCHPERAAGVPRSELAELWGSAA